MEIDSPRKNKKSPHENENTFVFASVPCCSQKLICMASCRDNHKHLKSYTTSATHKSGDVTGLFLP
jgi:hypothetical protein